MYFVSSFFLFPFVSCLVLSLFHSLCLPSCIYLFRSFFRPFLISHYLFVISFGVSFFLYLVSFFIPLFTCYLFNYVCVLHVFVISSFHVLISVFRSIFISLSLP